MKANRAAINNDRAEVGVGTLIVFIAMVLVAAVAAAVLINTTGTLQQRAQATGKDATQEVSSNLKVVNVYGIRPGTASTDDIAELKINVMLSAGALPMDLEKLIIRYTDGTAAPVNYVWVAGPESLTAFEPTWIRGAATGVAGDSVMKAGDLVELHFLIATDIAERKDVDLTLIPESGSSVIADFSTPASYGSETTLTLR